MGVDNVVFFLGQGSFQGTKETYQRLVTLNQGDLFEGGKMCFEVGTYRNVLFVTQGHRELIVRSTRLSYSERET
jgi:hypothetical protein